MPSFVRDNDRNMPSASTHTIRHRRQDSADPPVVLVLGGSGVIGSAVCLCFAENGWNVGVQYHARRQSADAIIHKIERLGRTSRAFQADMSETRQIHTLFDQVQIVWSELDAIVWAAGSTVNRLTIRITPAEWERMLNVNLTGLFLCLQRGLRLMSEQRGGAVTVVSSLSSSMGGTGQTAYAACKAGALGLVKSAARELGKTNVRVNAVFPGWHQSPLTGDAFPDPDQLHAHVLERTPSLDNVADFVYRLTTARDISGQVYNLDNRIH